MRNHRVIIRGWGIIQHVLQLIWNVVYELVLLLKHFYAVWCTISVSFYFYLGHGKNIYVVEFEVIYQNTSFDILEGEA